MVVVVVVVVCFVDPVYMLMLHLSSWFCDDSRLFCLGCVFCIASLPLDTMGSSVVWDSVIPW